MKDFANLNADNSPWSAADFEKQNWFKIWFWVSNLFARLRQLVSSFVESSVPDNFAESQAYSLNIERKPGSFQFETQLKLLCWESQPKIWQMNSLNSIQPSRLATLSGLRGSMETRERTKTIISHLARMLKQIASVFNWCAFEVPTLNSKREPTKDFEQFITMISKCSNLRAPVDSRMPIWLHWLTCKCRPGAAKHRWPGYSLSFRSCETMKNNSAILKVFFCLKQRNRKNKIKS